MTSVAQPPPSPAELAVIQVPVSDPRVEPLIRELGDEYSARYGKGDHAELARYPDAATTGNTEVVGTYSGAGAALQGLIAAPTKKDNRLVKPLADALNEVVDNGTYAKVLTRSGLADEAVAKSEIKPARPAQDQQVAVSSGSPSTVRGTVRSPAPIPRPSHAP